jgi:hypothetical protein
MLLATEMRRALALLVAASLGSGSARAVDSDLDGYPDGADNCLFEPNDQSDRGGIGARDADGVGDACQCGDLDEDGAVLARDVAALRASLTDPAGAALPAHAVAKCTVHGDRPAPCSLVDAAILSRALAATPLAPGIAQACGKALCSACTSAFQPTAGGCPLFPEDNPWNQDIRSLPVHPRSEIYKAAIDSFNPGTEYLRLDLGSTETDYGIPWIAVPPGQAPVAISYGVDGEDYSDESDPGPFPIPPDAPIEGGSPTQPDPPSGDRHVLAVDQTDCTLYELYRAVRTSAPVGFRVAASARWNLLVNHTRPAGWTSADAAGMAMLPGLLRREEVARGRIDHALRVTFVRAARAWVAPGNHYGGYPDDSYLPYGARLRLREGYPETGYSADARVLIRALKRYGLIFADQGTNGYISGTSHPDFAPLLAQINQGAGAPRIPLSELDVIDTGDARCGWSTPSCF